MGSFKIYKTQNFWELTYGKSLIRTSIDSYKDNLISSAYFRYKRKAKKRSWNTSNTWSKFAQIERIFLRTNCKIRGQRYWRNQRLQVCIFLYLVCRVGPGIKTKSKNASRKLTEVGICLVYFVLTKTYSMVYVLALIVNQKWKNKIYKFGKVDDRIQILQLARYRNKRQKETEIWIEKDGFTTSSRLDWKILEWL